MLKLSDMIHVGEKPSGTVPGGIYRDKQQRLWMVKFPQTNLHAANEVLAARLYEEAGVRVPTLALVDCGNEKRAVASLWNQSYRPSRLSRKLIGLMDGFVIDAWLANWDVVGQDFDNIMRDGDYAVRVDLGGSLMFRAQGGNKGDGFSTYPVEIATLLDPSINKQSAAVFGRLTMSDLFAGRICLKHIQPEKIKQLVAQCEVPSVIGDVLIKRRDRLMKEIPCSDDQFTMH